MLSSSTPRLSKPEWAAVARALIEAEELSRVSPAPPGSIRAYAGKVVRLLSSAESAPSRRFDPRSEAVYRFVSVARSNRRAATNQAAELIEHGFNEAQIEALTLLAA